MALPRSPLAKANRLTVLLVIVLLVLSMGAWLLVLASARAETWPSSWMAIDQDQNEGGTSNDYRDVAAALYNFDDSYLYLRLRLYGTPDFSGPARYKWFIDLGVGQNLHMSGSNVLGAEYLLFVEDSNDDGSGEVYLLDAHGDDRFSEYEPGIYKTSPGPIDPTIAGYRFDGRCVDLYVKLSQLQVGGVGRANPCGIGLAWATDQEDNNLEQGQTTDTMDSGDMPILIGPVIDVSKTDSADPVEAGEDITYTVTMANSGNMDTTDGTGDEFQDSIPTDTIYAPGTITVDGFSNDDDTWDGIGYDAVSNQIIWNGVVPASGSVSVSFRVTVVSPLANGSQISNQGMFCWDSDGDGAKDASELTDDPFTAGDNDPTVTTVHSTPELVITKGDGPDPVRPGETLTYTIVYENTGNQIAHNVVITETYDANVTFLSASPAPDSGTNNRWTVPSLSPTDGQQTITVKVRVKSLLAQGTILHNNVAISCDEGVSEQASEETTIAIPPAIAYSPASLSFAAIEAGANPSSQTLSLWNAGGGALDWSVSDDAGWLTLSPTGGSSTGEVDDIAVSVNISGMEAGSYSAIITISAPGASNMPQTVLVSLSIEPPPSAIGYSPWSLSFAAIEGDANPLSQTLSLWNSGGGALDWSVSDGAAWLTLSPTEGNSTGEVDNIAVSVDISGIEAGSYSAIITISAPGASNTPQTVLVSLTIEPPPSAIAYSPSSLSFAAIEGDANPSSQTLSLWNSGGGALDWSVSNDAGWLTLSLTGGSSTGEVDDVTILVDISGMEAGSYSTTIIISAPVASNTPQGVPVSLNIEPLPPTIAYSPSSLSFAAIEGGANPSSQTLSLWNSGGGALDWSVSDDAGWLTLNPTGGISTGEVDDIAVSVDISGMEAASYSAIITISAPGASNTPQTVLVSLTIEPPPSAIAYSPSSLSFAAIEGDANPSSQTLSLWNSGGGALDWSVSDDAGWLTLNPTEGSSTGEVDDIAVSVDISGMEPGEYSATIAISAPGAGNTPQVVPVSLTIEPRPVIPSVPLPTISCSCVMVASGGNVATLSPGDVLQCHLLAFNLGHDASAKVLHFELPEYLSVTEVSVEPQGVASIAGNQVGVSMGNLTAGEATLTITMEVNQSVMPGVTIDTVCGDLATMPVLFVTVTSDCASVSPGDTVHFTIKATALGLSEVSDVRVKYQVPSELSVIQASVEPKGTVSLLANEINARLGTIAGGNSVTVTIAAEVGQGMPPDTSVDEWLGQASLFQKGEPVSEIDTPDYEVEVTGLQDRFASSWWKNWLPLVIIPVALAGLLWCLLARRKRKGQSSGPTVV